jgi:benzoate membrane transport protein
VIVVWLLALRFASRWATPIALLTAIVVIVVSTIATGVAVEADDLVPRVVLTTPQLTVGAIVSIAVPLFVVTMASQNIPGVAVMKGLGFEVPWRRSMLVTGVGTMAGAAAGGHAINLAAISAALAAGPEAGEDRSRRWIASVTAGGLYLVFGVGASAFAALIVLAPSGVIPAVAGLALLGTFAASLQAALADPPERIPAVVTFAAAASGIAVAGLTAAFLALLAGLVVRAVLSRRT